MSIWETNVKEGGDPKHGDSCTWRISDKITLIISYCDSLGYYITVDTDEVDKEMMMFIKLLQHCGVNSYSLYMIKKTVEHIVKCVIDPPKELLKLRETM